MDEPPGIGAPFKAIQARWERRAACRRPPRPDTNRDTLARPCHLSLITFTVVAGGGALASHPSHPPLPSSDSYSKYYRDKLETPVTFPLDGLDLSEHVLHHASDVDGQVSVRSEPRSEGKLTCFGLRPNSVRGRFVIVSSARVRFSYPVTRFLILV